MQFGREAEQMARQIDVGLGFAVRHAGAHHLFHLVLGLKRRQEGRRDWSHANWRRRHRLPIVTPNAAARGCRNRFDVATGVLDGRKGPCSIRIPRFASVGRHGHVVVSADRLAGLGLAFSRTVQVVFGRSVLCCRRRRLLFFLSCRVLAHFGRPSRRFLQWPATAERR